MKYRAFISYSHADARAAAWWHRALEGYAVPAALVGSAGRHGPVPARLFPVFRDREELSSAADLPARLDEAIAQSQAMVVICSPAAARSRWVEQEILRYAQLHGREQLHALIVDGEPHAGDGRECFPLALRQRIDGDGLAQPVEPLAADARATGDGRDDARLKLLAGLLGVDLDRLRQRDQQRRRQRNRLWAAAALVVIGLLAGAAWYANLRRIEAEDAGLRAERAAAAERVARGAESEARVLAERRADEARRARDAEAVQRGRAESERATAVAQRRVAEQERRIAQQQRDLAHQRQQVALARQLAAQAERLRAEQPGELHLAALLAVEAARRLDTLETQQALIGVRRVLPPLPQRLGSGSSMARVRYTADGSAFVAEGPHQLALHRAGTTQPDWTAPTAGETEWTLTSDGCCLLSWSARQGWLLRRLADGHDVEPRPAWLDALRGQRVRYRHALGFNAAGDLLAVDGTVLRVPGGGPAAPPLRWAAFSADGRWFAQAGDGRLQVRAHDGTLAADFPVPHDPRVALAGDGRHVLAWGDRWVELFDVPGRRSVFRRECGVPFFAAAFAPSAPQLALACSTEVLLLDARSGAVTAMLRHDRPIADLQFHPSGRWLLTASYDRTARVWDLASGRELWRATHDGYVASAQFAPDGRAVVTGSSGDIRRWQLDLAPDVLAELPQGIERLALSVDGAWAAAAGAENRPDVNLVDMRSGRVRRILTAPGRVSALTLSADGTLLAAASGGILQLRRVADGGKAPPQAWDWPLPGGPGERVAAAAFAADGELRLTLVRPSRASPLDSEAVMLRCPAPGVGAAWRCVPEDTPPVRGRGLGAAYGPGAARAVLWADAEPMVPSLWPRQPVPGSTPPTPWQPMRLNAAAHNGGQTFVALTAGRVIERLPQPGRPALRVPHDGWVHHLALSPDGAFLAAALSDPTSPGKNRVVIHRTSDGAEVARFDRPGSDGPVAFAPDGRLVYGHERTLRALPWRPADLSAQVCARLPRNLGCDEWRQWLGDEPYRATCAGVAAAPSACAAPR